MVSGFELLSGAKERSDCRTNLTPADRSVNQTATGSLLTTAFAGAAIAKVERTMTITSKSTKRDLRFCFPYIIKCRAAGYHSNRIQFPGGGAVEDGTTLPSAVVGSINSIRVPSGSNKFA